MKKKGELICCCRNAWQNCDIDCERWKDKRKPDVVCVVTAWTKDKVPGGVSDERD